MLNFFNKAKGPGFNPSEIIFAVTDRCNLKCSHCFVSRRNCSLESAEAINFLESCRESEGCAIDRIGFSGGEPFLNLDFVLDVVRWGRDNDFYFDRLMTNGVWWNTIEQLESRLTLLSEAGFDGKICISFDSFHGQDEEKLVQFVKSACNVFRANDIIQIQSVADDDAKSDSEFLSRLHNFAELLNCNISYNLDINLKSGEFIISGEDEFYIQGMRTCLSYEDDERAWKSERWFPEDFCISSGQIIYVHADGKIAPCCGFANEEKELIVGNISMSFDVILDNARKNKMVDICYSKGLLKTVKKMRKDAKTCDPCAACKWVCRNIEKLN